MKITKNLRNIGLKTHIVSEYGSLAFNVFRFVVQIIYTVYFRPITLGKRPCTSV